MTERERERKSDFLKWDLFLNGFTAQPPKWWASTDGDRYGAEMSVKHRGKMQKSCRAAFPFSTGYSKTKPSRFVKVQRHH